jgi:hypothetical protein
LPLLRKVENQVERWGYIRRVAERLGVPPEVLKQELDPYQTPQGRRQSRVPTPLKRPTRVLPEYILLQMLCHDLRFLDQVQCQMELSGVTPEDFDDADLRAIYTLLLHVASQGELTISPRLIDEVTNPKQRELLHQMAVEPVLSNPADKEKALHDCLTSIRQRQFKVQRQSLIAQLHTEPDGAAKDRLLQEYNKLTKEQPIGSS